jgi:sterol desaturase/sphingolipid hydroxylase (fatty acid hydroxylase superfamily)
LSKLVAFAFLFLLFVPLERLFPLHPDQKIFRSGFLTDVVHFLINEVLIKVSTFLLALPIFLLTRDLFPALKAWIAGLHGGLQFLLAILIADFFGYWAHRLHHSVPFLWKLHSVHHSPGTLDWLSSARVHPINVGINRAIGAAPLLLLGFTKATFGAYLIFVGLWGLFLHSNVRFELKILRRVFATPFFHHWHHSKDPEGQNKNFAGQFPWMDALFGTLFLPDHWPKEYGIQEKMPDGYFSQMKFPFS